MTENFSDLNKEIEWKYGLDGKDGYVDYETATAFMEQRVADIQAGKAPECIWFLEHPPLYTAGTSAKREDLLTPDRFPVYDVGRGGQYTYQEAAIRENPAQYGKDILLKLFGQ